MVFGGSQDLLWILRYCQSPLLSLRLRCEKVALFWLLSCLRRGDSCESYRDFVALSSHDAWTSWVLLIVEIQAFSVSCLVEKWENKRTIRQQRSQQDDPCMKRPMSTKKETRRTLSCFNSPTKNKTNQQDHSRTTCLLTPYSNKFNYYLSNLNNI